MVVVFQWEVLRFHTLCCIFGRIGSVRCCGAFRSFYVLMTGTSHCYSSPAIINALFSSWRPRPHWQSPLFEKVSTWAYLSLLASPLPLHSFSLLYCFVQQSWSDRLKCAILCHARGQSLSVILSLLYEFTTQAAAILVLCKGYRRFAKATGSGFKF